MQRDDIRPHRALQVACRDATQRRKTMKPAVIATALLGAVCLSLIPQAYAQGPGAHSMVTPDQLQWNDVPALGAGVKLALIEGPMNEAVPFMVRVKCPAGTKVAAHWHPAIEHVT